MSENPQVVLITGTRKGIGRHLAHHYAAKGMMTVGCSRQPADFAMGNYEHVLADVTDETQVRAMLSAVQRRYGRLDVLINNAGVASMNHALLTPTETVRKILETNFTATFVLCREAVRFMRRHGSGRIVNMGTVAVPMNIEGEAVYAASKSAVVTLTKILAKELAPFNITCN